ncbi:DUF3035 domain-containing protein [Sphingomonas bacterium]|uniref:DUF3035 domain-containing protein n=1 Tax=Sphingomonas bacterium TaxID=1895847 RepID=UPI0015750678|nr:DUF3035 domain-containing protein [Sphingomonas bacterium]
MRKSVFLAIGLGAALLAGCGHRGYDRARPDEFAVARQAPLVIPPDFSLAPPRPGEVRPQDTASNAQTLDALFGGTAPRSGSETAIVAEAGGSEAGDAGVRSNVGDPKTTVVNKGATTRDIVAAPQGDGRDARATAN